MKTVVPVLVIGLVVLGAAVSHAQHAGDAVKLEYGTIEGMQEVEDKGRRAAGTLTGGMAGAIIADDHPGLGAVAGGLLGGAIQKHATKKTLMQYSVSLMSGATVIVNTEQEDLIKGDCVVVEKGQYVNIRRVSEVNCHLAKQDPEYSAEHHVSGADNCQLAKNELNQAKTSEAVETAVIKVRTLCED